MGKSGLKKGTALLLVLCIAATLAQAAAFSDVNAAGHWAKGYIEEMAEAGVITGYTDGTFRPENNVTTLELLVLCSRILALDADVAAQVYADHKEYLDNLFGAEFAWAHDEMAVCLEAGVVTKTELEALRRLKRLDTAAEKELLAVFLVRAMQLEPEASDPGSSFVLPFGDAASVTKERKPYVYVLYTHGIVEGTSQNNFEPKSKVTRAVTATMLCRAAEYMAENGIAAELPGYTDAPWTAGIVTGVSVQGNLLTVGLNSAVSGAKTLAIPAAASFTLDGAKASHTSVAAGRYMKARQDKAGVVTAVRITSSPETLSGTVVSVSDTSLTLLAAGASRRFTIANDTEVSAEGVAGGPEVIDPDGEYETALCVADKNGTLFSLVLTGGVYEHAGLIREISGRTLLLSGRDGVPRRLTVPAEAQVSVNGVPSEWKDSFAGLYGGKYAALKTEKDGAVSSVAIETTNFTAVQGVLKAMLLTSAPKILYLSDVRSGSITGYPVAENAACYSEGEAAALSALPAEAFATIKVAGGAVTEVHTWPGSVAVEGKISSLTFGAAIVLGVAPEDGPPVEFSLDPANLPAIRQDGVRITADKLKRGDSAAVYMKYGEIDRIETEIQSDTAMGTVARITRELSGNVLTLLEDGEENEYILSDAVTITEGDKSIALADLKIGSLVSLVIRDGEVTSVKVEQAAVSSNELTGTVLFVNDAEKTLLVDTENSAGTPVMVTVRVKTGTKILAADGSALTLQSLKIMDKIQAIGAYSGAVFEAAILIRR